MATRPRVLYLAYFFRPVNVVAAVRTWNTARQLVRHGWDVTVMSADPTLFWSVEPLDRVEDDLREIGVRQIITGHDAVHLSPRFLKQREGIGPRVAGKIARMVASLAHRLPESGWIRPCMEADRAFPAGSFDLVLATGCPFAAFVIAQQIARRHGCPYVLDYRDLWTGDPHNPVPRWQRRIEGHAVLGASAVTTVSDQCAKLLDEQHRLSSKLHVVPNGFDPDSLDGVTPAAFGHPAIVYGGNLYPPIRTIDPVMAALARIEERPGARVSPHKLHFYGIAEEHVRASARKWGVVHRVECHGTVPRTEVLSAIRGAAAAVVITSVQDTGSDAVLGIVTGKLFEILGLGTPALLISPRGSDAETVLARAGGGRSFVGSDIEGIAAYLWERITSPKPAPGDAHEFTWDHLGKRLDAILRSVLCGLAIALVCGLGAAAGLA